MFGFILRLHLLGIIPPTGSNELMWYYVHMDKPLVGLTLCFMLWILQDSLLYIYLHFACNAVTVQQNNSLPPLWKQFPPFTQGAIKKILLYIFLFAGKKYQKKWWKIQRGRRGVRLRWFLKILIYIFSTGVK